jgi:4-hydroxybenzoate polyprenyltransferase
VSAGGAPARSRARELGRFLEIQNLGLNLPLALAFLFLAAGGLPAVRTIVLVVVAFVAARNAGHSFNRWADRAFDAANPRTRGRSLPAGTLPPSFAVVLTVANAALLLVAAYLLNPLAFVLAPVALALLLGYSYSKRVTSLTTPFLGLVEAIIPAAVFIAVRGELPPQVLLAVAGLIAWGTAFETVHSMGDVESDRALGLLSLPQRLGPRRSVRLVVGLHAAALGLLAGFGVAFGLSGAYYAGLAVMGAIAGLSDARLARDPTQVRVPFERHFAMAFAFLVGVLVAVFVPAFGALPGATLSVVAPRS